MKKYQKLLEIICISFVVVIIGCYSIYRFNLSAPSKTDNEIVFEVSTGESLLTVADDLKEQKLIRSELFYKIYIKLHKSSGLEAGTYYLNTNMSTPEIIDTLSGKSHNTNVFMITFKEGINMRRVASLIEENTEYTKEDVFEWLENEAFIDKMINTYWFLTDEIKNEGIYYPLEGYLFPNTYEFNKNASLEDIFMTLLDGTNTVLMKYKKEIEQSDYTIHEMLTLASIVELEAAASLDRAGVAGVFYNRLENNWALGSDVTTYYAIQVDMNERDLYKAELDDYNAYNTRCSKMAGKLPVGPICNAGEDSIKAAINPTKHDYFYFVADKNKKTYFSKTNSEHNKTVADLKSAGLWYTY